jgi:predicted PurR-regulated permease PerM
MTDSGFSRDPVRATLAGVFLAGMIVATYWIVQPFLPAALWAVTIVVASWPLLLRVEALLGGRRGLAVAVMTVLLLLCLLVPLAFALNTILTNAEAISGWLRSLAAWSIPPPPEWLAHVPFAGPRLTARWADAAAATPQEISARLAPYSREAVAWVASTIGDLGLLLVQFLLVVLFAAILYASGERAAAATRRFAWRLAGARGEHAARLAVSAIRGVAVGIVLTALIQTCLAAVGLLVVGVPFAMVLTAVVFVSCIAQIGPAPVLIAPIVWTYWTRGSGWGTALLVWSLAVAVVDNVLRPMLIRKGADLPLLLVFLGVVGGLLAFGIIGIFIGPVVLAVGYSLLADWVNRPPSPAAPSPPAPLAADRDLAPVAER